MNPEKVLKVLTCECGAAVEDNSKYRGRFIRRHRRDLVCQNYARVQAELRTAQEINNAAKAALEGNDGTRVDMSGNTDVAGEVDGGILQGGAQ